MKTHKIVQIRPTEFKDSKGEKRVIIYSLTKSGELYACIFDPEKKESLWARLGNPVKKS